MKRILFLLIILLACMDLHAAPGDTTVVPIHILDSLSYYGTYTRQANMPASNVTYRKIYFVYTIGKYQCPAGSQYCGQWDYSLDFIAKPLNPLVSTEEFEIARGITPYALTSTFFPWTWTHTYMLDVTDFAPILRDSVQIKAAYSGYSGGFTLATKLMFIEGTPGREPVAIRQVQRGYYGYDANIENYLIPDTVTLQSPATNADMLVSITGHGSDNNGCSEFCQKYYRVNLNGTQIVQKDIWRKCGFCDIQAQTGTWPYDRGNWCPGEKVLANRHALPGVSTGTPFVVDMDLEAYTPPNGGAGYSVASYVVSYKDPAFTLDAELEDIISPSTKDDYIKYNGGCDAPVIVIKNNGTSKLNSLLIHYGMNGQINASYTWTGELAFNQTQIVTLPPIPWGNFFTDSSDFMVRIEQPNGGTDQYAANDTLHSLYRIVPVMPETFIVELRTNNTYYSTGTLNESSWYLLDMNGDTIRSRTQNANNTTYRDTISLLPGGCYTLMGIDEGYEDGLSFWYYQYYGFDLSGPVDTPGNGYIKLRNASTGGLYSDNLTKFNKKYLGGDFGSKFLYNFKVDFPTGTPVHEKPTFECRAYPIPAMDEINVELLGLQDLTNLYLMDMKGNILQQQSAQKDGIFHFDTHAYPPGLYFLKIADKAHVEIRKIAIVR
ncbi:MAG: T9SS type A sorting domain-containing protein [Chitinophagaceae bacterium]|nr:T9SS type A sorting domain-containing protein [Chitinophagaceae bacterium]